MVQTLKMAEKRKVLDQKILMTYSPNVRKDSPKQMMLAKKKK